MYEVKILPLAKGDIQEAALWYNRQRKGLGKRFTAQIRDRISVIQRYPKISPIRSDEVRTAVIDIFPFMIHYTVDEIQKHIIVAAVFHTSRNPKIWKRR